LHHLPPPCRSAFFSACLGLPPAFSHHSLHLVVWTSRSACRFSAWTCLPFHLPASSYCLCLHLPALPGFSCSWFVLLSSGFRSAPAATGYLRLLRAMHIATLVLDYATASHCATHHRMPGLPHLSVLRASCAHRLLPFCRAGSACRRGSARLLPDLLPAAVGSAAAAAAAACLHRCCTCLRARGFTCLPAAITFYCTSLLLLLPRRRTACHPSRLPCRLLCLLLRVFCLMLDGSP